MSKEADAARDVAEAFCDVDHGFSICDDGRLFVGHKYYIDPDTFDMTDLIEGR